jgi:hypothetical protein
MDVLTDDSNKTYFDVALTICHHTDWKSITKESILARVENFSKTYLKSKDNLNQKLM